MRIVTIEDFGRNDPGSKEHLGYIYQGNAWQFRFTISSPDHFFSAELPHLIDVFEIDTRQIYALTLYRMEGWGEKTPFEVRLFVSFLDEQEPPDESVMEKLQCRVPQVRCHPSHCDELVNYFRDFLKVAAPRTKGRIAKALAQEVKNAEKDGSANG